MPQLVASAHGVVLDLGPGTGNQLERFDASKIEHVYGVEPNTAFTKPLMERLRTTKLGQDGKYTLIPCGIEDEETLARFGVVEGSVDCIVSVQVLVSLCFSPLVFSPSFFGFRHVLSWRGRRGEGTERK